jgi:hypothetical protein
MDIPRHTTRSPFSAMENFADLPQPETAPHIWLDPFTEESIPMVDAACDRWLKRRADLRRKRDERLAAQLPSVPSAGNDCHSDLGE